MRHFLTLALSVATAGPGAAMAQDVPAQDPSARPPAATPPPDAAPVAAPVTAEAPPPEPAKADATPSLDGATATTVAPVLVEGKDAPRNGKVANKVGTVAGGVIGGVAGAAVAGPVGKVAGGLVGKRMAKTLFGAGKDKPAPAFREAQVAPSADQAAAATAELSRVPPSKEAAADPEAPTP